MLCGSSTQVAMQRLATTKQLYTPFADTPERYSIAIPGTTQYTITVLVFNYASLEQCKLGYSEVLAYIECP